MSTIKRADRIVVLDKGMIREQVARLELRKLGGLDWTGSRLQAEEAA